MKSWARIMGAVTLVVTSDWILSGEEAEGSLKVKDFWIPAMAMMVLMSGWAVRISATWVGRVAMLEVSIFGWMLLLSERNAFVWSWFAAVYYLLFVLKARACPFVELQVVLDGDRLR